MYGLCWKGKKVYKLAGRKSKRQRVGRESEKERRKKEREISRQKGIGRAAREGRDKEEGRREGKAGEREKRWMKEKGDKKRKTSGLRSCHPFKERERGGGRESCDRRSHLGFIGLLPSHRR